MHIQLLHTSASLAINENWDPDVRDDMEMMLNRIVPEDLPFRHSCEGPDDMVNQPVFRCFSRQLSYVIKTQLNSPKAPSRWHFVTKPLVLVSFGSL